MKMMSISKEYPTNLKKYHVVDGLKAILLYIICIAILVIQGLVYTTNLSANSLNLLQIVFPLGSLLIAFPFILSAKEKFASIGLTQTNLFKSLSLGIILAICFIFGISVYLNMSIHFQLPALSIVSIFIIGAIEEEIIFRGYIETRLSGIVKNSLVCSICTAFLFLFMHYPTRWISGGFSFDTLSAFYVVCLLILHFICAFVYKKTNCLWGAIILHLLYNLGQSMMI